MAYKCKYLLTYTNVPNREEQDHKVVLVQFGFFAFTGSDSLVLFEFCAFFGIPVLIQLGFFSLQNMGSSWLRSVLFSSCEETLIWSSTAPTCYKVESTSWLWVTLRYFSICCCWYYYYYLNRLCLTAPAYCSRDNFRLGQISSCHLANTIIIL